MGDTTQASDSRLRQLRSNLSEENCKELPRNSPLKKMNSDTQAHLVQGQLRRHYGG